MQQLPRLLPAVLVALLAFAPSAAAYTPLSPSAVTVKLNELRTAHGFPANVVENPVLSAGCLAHNAWMELNNSLSHGEAPGTPGYTTAGDQAALISVLAQGPSWETGNPWLNAPIHLADLLQPGMVETGASEEHGRSCLTTHSALNLQAAPPSVDTFWSYPGNGATMPSSQTAFEAPSPPQTYGRQPIPAGVPTGPNLIAFLRGPQAASRSPKLSSATLRGPGGVAVPVMTVHTTFLSLLPEGAGVVVPRQPLVPGATYIWTTTWTAPATSSRPAYRFTSPARTFTTTAEKLCGVGIGGWSAASCPSSPLRVSAPRSISVSAAALSGISLTVTLDGTGWTGATLKSGRRALATSSATVGANRRGTMRLKPGARTLLTLLGTRRSMVLTIDVKASSTYVRHLRITVTR